MSLPIATVYRIVPSWDNAVWLIQARCPDGRKVQHGGGPTSGDPTSYLGERGSHCFGLPATRSQPACSHDHSYRLELGEGVKVPKPLAPRTRRSPRA